MARALRVCATFVLLLGLFGSSTSLPALADSCSIDTLSASASGTSVQVHAHASCSSGLRAIRLKADGNIFYELGAPDVTATWNGASPGSHTITAEVAAQGDNDWSGAVSRSTGVSVSGSPPPPTPAPTPSCSVDQLSTSTSGNSIQVHAHGSCNTGVRAIRLSANGSIFYELGAPDLTAAWNAPGPGSYSIRAEVAGQGDNDWSHAASQSTTATVAGPPTAVPTASLNRPRITGVAPGAPSPVGTNVCVNAAIDWNSAFRSMRIRLGSSGWQESSETSFQRCFGTSGWTAGSYTIRVEAAAQGDNSWSSPTSVEQSYQLTDQSAPPTPPTTPADPGLNQPRITNISPSSPAVVGTNVCVQVGIDWNSTFRSMRIRLGSSGWQESSETSFQRCFDTSGWSDGNYTIRVEAAAQGDNSWSNPRVAQTTYRLQSASVLVTPVPPPVAATCQQLGLNTGDFIRGSADEIDIVAPGCVRRWVPNPDTLTAISSRTGRGVRQISDSSLQSLTKGADIPDVDRDPDGFARAMRDILGVDIAAPQPPTPTPAQGPQPSSACQQLGLNPGDLIKAAGDEIDIVDANCQRRWVPNPSTFNALSSCQSRPVTGLAQSDFASISKGSDIPDNNVDPNGFSSARGSIYGSCGGPVQTPITSTTPSGCHDGNLVPGGAIEQKWCSLGGSGGLLGSVTVGERTAASAPSGTTGVFAAFQHGHIHYSSNYGAFETHGAIDGSYLQVGGSGGWLGFPTSDEYDWNGGRRNDFESGYIYWDGQRAQPFRTTNDARSGGPPNLIEVGETRTGLLLPSQAEDVVVSSDGVDGKVKIKNFPHLWFDLSVTATNGASIDGDGEIDKIVDKLGLMPPDYEQTYRVHFTSMDQSIVVHEEMGPVAGSINIVQILIGEIKGQTAVKSYESWQEAIAIIKTVPRFKSAGQHLANIVTAPVWQKPVEVGLMANDVFGALQDTVQRQDLIRAFAALGLDVSEDQLKEAFSWAHVVDLCQTIADEVVTIVVSVEDGIVPGGTVPITPGRIGP